MSGIRFEILSESKFRTSACTQPLHLQHSWLQQAIMYVRAGTRFKSKPFSWSKNNFQYTYIIYIYITVVWILIFTSDRERMMMAGLRFGIVLWNHTGLCIILEEASVRERRLFKNANNYYWVSLRGGQVQCTLYSTENGNWEILNRKYSYWKKTIALGIRLYISLPLICSSFIWLTLVWTLFVYSFLYLENVDQCV